MTSPVSRAQIVEAIAQGLFHPCHGDDFQNVWLVNNTSFVGAGLEEGNEPYYFHIFSGCSFEEYLARTDSDEEDPLSHVKRFVLDMDDLLQAPHIEPQLARSPYISAYADWGATGRPQK